eukprot:5322352-Pyramimonas_sp.AAC.1
MGGGVVEVAAERRVDWNVVPVVREEPTWEVWDYAFPHWLRQRPTGPLRSAEVSLRNLIVVLATRSGPEIAGR